MWDEKFTHPLCTKIRNLVQMLYIIDKRDFCEVKEAYGVTKKCRLGGILGSATSTSAESRARCQVRAQSLLQSSLGTVYKQITQHLWAICVQSVFPFYFHHFYWIRKAWTELCFHLIGIERLQQMLHTDDAKPVVNNASSTADSSCSPEEDSSGTPSNTPQDDASQIKNILVF